MAVGGGEFSRHCSSVRVFKKPPKTQSQESKCIVKEESEVKKERKKERKKTQLSKSRVKTKDPSTRDSKKLLSQDLHLGIGLTHAALLRRQPPSPSHSCASRIAGQVQPAPSPGPSLALG
jgi:hypothetical protein